MGDITISQLAKDLQMYPQQIYKLIREGKFSQYEVEGKKYVDEMEARRVIANSRRKTKEEKAAEVKKHSRVKKGDLVSWHPNARQATPRTKQTVGVVTVHDSSDLESGLSTVRLGSSATEAALFKSLSLEARVESGQVAIHSPEQVLRIVCQSLEIRGQTNTASTLRQWVDKNKERLQ